MNKHNKNSIIRRHLFILVLITAVIFIYDLSGIGCPIRYLTGYPCPTCGMTRALISILRADFRSYLEYNPMTLPVIAAILLAVHRDLFRRKLILDITVIFIAVSTITVYILINLI